MYPYCPAHIARPKEVKRLFLVALPERCYLAVSFLFDKKRGARESFRLQLAVLSAAASPRRGALRARGACHPRSAVRSPAHSPSACLPAAGAQEHAADCGAAV